MCLMALINQKTVPINPTPEVGELTAVKLLANASDIFLKVV